MTDIGIHWVRSVEVETKESGGTIWTVLTIRSGYGNLPEQLATVTLYHHTDGIAASFVDGKYAPVAEAA